MTRLEWAVPFIRRGRALGELPSYGTPAWCSLPANDPRKIASVVVAAECWAAEIDPILMRQRLEDEITARRQAEAKIDAEEWRQAASNVVKISTSRRRAPWESRARRGAS